MKDPNCTQCQEWAICPFHPADEAPATERLAQAEAAPANPKLSFAPAPAPTTEESMREWLANDPKLRLLGPDDPEVSSDLIYLDEATGGLVGVPRTRIQHTASGVSPEAREALHGPVDLADFFRMLLAILPSYDAEGTTDP